MNMLKQVFKDPPRYQPETPWGPWSALAATAVIVLAPLVILMIMMGVYGASESAPGAEARVMKDMMRLNTPLGILALGATQLMSVALVWWFAGRKGMRWPTLSLIPNPPSYAQCIALGAFLIVTFGLIELALYYLIQFDVFKDSKFLVEGLRSAMWPFTLILAVVLAPLWEELTFRGFLLSALAKTRLGIVGGGLISTAIWTALHASYSIPALVSVFVAGLVMTWLVWKTGSLRPAIVTHAMVNASAVVFAGLFSPY